MPVLTKSIMVCVRFKSGVPRVLEKVADRAGQRRATWVRGTVLQHAETLLRPHEAHALGPLPDVTADGAGESVLIRFTMKEHKLIVRAASKSGMKLSTYIRAVCMRVLERREWA